MSATYIQILKLAAGLSKEECLMLIKDLSSALVDKKDTNILESEFDKLLLKQAIETRLKVRKGEIKTFGLSEVKEKFNGRN